MEQDYGKKSYATLGFFQVWAVAILLLTGLSFLVDQFIPGSVAGYVIGLSILLTCLIILRLVQLIYDRLERKKFDYQQLEALLGLYHHLSPGVQLPPLRNHAGSPDFLNLLIEILERKRPKVIVEAGSGVSSMVISEWLMKNAPETVHFALDHEEKYADLTRQRVRNPNTQVIHAPLRNYPLDGTGYQWYDLDQIPIEDKIDLLIVDGPPAPLHQYARYPALPLLSDKMADGATLILDDCIRESEREIVRRWTKSHSLQAEYRPLEKGAYVLELAKDRSENK